MVFKSECFICCWTYSVFAPKLSVVSQSSAHDSCQQKSQRLLNMSPPHVMSSVILYRVATSRYAGWDNGGEPEVTVPYACTMARQWRHRGQVTMHLLPVWQLFLEVYWNQKRSLLMSQHISTFFLFVSLRSCARSSTESRLSPSADTDHCVLSLKIWRQPLQRWAACNKMCQLQVPGIIKLSCLIPRET